LLYHYFSMENNYYKIFQLNAPQVGEIEK